MCIALLTICPFLISLPPLPFPLGGQSYRIETTHIISPENPKTVLGLFPGRTKVYSPPDAPLPKLDYAWSADHVYFLDGSPPLVVGFTGDKLVAESDPAIFFFVGTELKRNYSVAELRLRPSIPNQIRLTVTSNPIIEAYGFREDGGKAVFYADTVDGYLLKFDPSSGALLWRELKYSRHRLEAAFPKNISMLKHAPSPRYFVGPVLAVEKDRILLGPAVNELIHGIGHDFVDVKLTSPEQVEHARVDDIWVVLCGCEGDEAKGTETNICVKAEFLQTPPARW